MADDLDHWKKRLDDEYGQITRRFNEIHERFDRVVHAQPGDNLRKLLKDLEKRVKKIRTGGLFRPGTNQYMRVLKKFNAAKGAASAGPQPQQFGR
jgi:hypothetical protein